MSRVTPTRPLSSAFSVLTAVLLTLGGTIATRLENVAPLGLTLPVLFRSNRGRGTLGRFASAGFRRFGFADGPRSAS